MSDRRPSPATPGDLEHQMRAGLNPPRLHVVRVSHGFPPRRDGLAHHAYLLSRYQAKAGHRISVFQSQLDTHTAEGVDIARITSGPLVLDPERTAHRWLFAALAARRLAEVHRLNAVDVVHCHGDLPDATLVSRTARRLGLPFVLTLHGALSRKPRYRLMASRAFRRVTRFIAVGEHIRDDLEALGVSPDRVDVVSSGIEYQRFATTVDAAEERRSVRAALGVSQDAVVVMSVGRLHPVKGYEDLVAAARELPSAVVVVLVGDGPQRPQLAVAAGGLANVRFAGSHTHSEMPALLRSADIFVLPSVDLPGQAEGTPTSAMEAMAAGLPLVVTNSRGSRRLVEQAGGGLVVEQRSPGQLRDAISALAADPERRRVMSRANQEAARERDWTLIAERVLDVYRKDLDERSRQR